MQLILKETEFTLLPEKALYHAKEKLLVIADVHLGKALHFRKAGIAIPANAQISDYNRLYNLFQIINPSKVYFLGDLFHSTFNNDWHSFEELIIAHPQIHFTLLKGNHDLINNSLFTQLNIAVTDTIENENFIYSHLPLKSFPANKINICGHIHPGISLSGSGRQSIKISCFYLHENVFILPAFGSLTGLFILKKKENSKVFIVLPEKVMSI